MALMMVSIRVTCCSLVAMIHFSGNTFYYN